MAKEISKEGLTIRIAKWLFLAYLFSIPFARPLGFRYLGISVHLSDAVFLSAAGFWVIALLSRGAPWIYHRFHVYVGVFGLAMTVSAFASTEPRLSLVKLAGVYYLIAVSLMTFSFALEVDYFKRMIWAFLLGTLCTVIGAFVGAAGFYLGYDQTSGNFLLFHYGSLPMGNYPRVNSFFNNANMMCNYLNVGMLFALAAGSARWIRLEFVSIFVAAILVAAFFTLSAGIGGLFLSGGIWIACVKLRRSSISRAVLVISILIAILAFASTLLSPVTRDTPHTVMLPVIETQVEPSVRVLVWQNAIARALEHPILGRGTGTDAAHLPYQAINGPQLLRDAHQAWLNIFGQAGFLGLAAFVALCIYLTTICRFDLESFTVYELFGVAASAAFMGAFLFQNLFGSFEDARHLWVLIGLLCACNYSEEKFGATST